MKEQQYILEVKKVSKQFSGNYVLKKVKFELKKGEIHALVGANGAGKSTLIKIITGVHKCDTGEIFIDGQKVDIYSPSCAKNMGISAVYQEFSLVDSLTVAENIFLGKLDRSKSRIIKTIDWKDINKSAKQVLKQMNCNIDTKQLVKKLGVAEKQLVEIAKALADNSKILIMDEPTASLTDNDIQNLFKVIKRLAEKGISIIYISHRLEELPVIADRVTVFRDGEYITTMDIKEATKERIIEYMVGKGLEHTPKVNKASDKVLLEVKGITGRKFSDISFKLHEGEILGISGLAGAGRTELARCIFGLEPKLSGDIIFKSKKVEINSPLDAKKLGIGFITEDRKGEGIIPRLDIKKNISITVLDRITRLVSINSKNELDLAKKYIKYLDIKATGVEQLVQKLSGGNQQKVIIAKWLAVNPSVLIMDEPTRGIDVGAKGQIYGILNKLADQGMGIIVISSEIPEILEISDRILVMADGRLTKEMLREEASQEKILHYATIQNEDRAVI